MAQRKNYGVCTTPTKKQREERVCTISEKKTKDEVITRLHQQSLRLPFTACCSGPQKKPLTGSWPVHEKSIAFAVLHAPLTGSGPTDITKFRTLMVHFFLPPAAATDIINVRETESSTSSEASRDNIVARFDYNLSIATAQ